MNSFDEAIERPHYYVITSPINSKELFITIYLIGPESQYEVYFKTRQDSCASDGFAGFFPLPPVVTSSDTNLRHSTRQHLCKGRERHFSTKWNSVMTALQGVQGDSHKTCAWQRRRKLSGLTHSADFLEVRAALHVVLTVIITVADGISRIPFPTSPCTAW